MSITPDSPSQSGPYRELTWPAVILGIIQGVIMNVSFVYAALKIGLSIGGSAVAAIMGYAILRGMMKVGTGVENNINQTIASGINVAGAGVVFTLPAVFLIDAQWRAQGDPGLSLSIWPLLIAGVAGTLLGTVVIIPLRKQMIEIDRLRFPTGIAVCTIIRSGAAGIEKAKLLGVGFLVSAAWKIIMLSGIIEIPGIIDGEYLHYDFGVLPEFIYPVIYLSPMILAAGMLAGRGGLPFFAGGLLSWWIISPMAYHLGMDTNRHDYR